MASESEHACRICDNRAYNLPLEAREMMFGIGESFEYFRCGACECLQIAEVPADMARHYPANYYSFPAGAPPTSALSRRIQSLRVESALEGSGVVDRLLSPFASFPSEIRAWLELLGATQDSRILDVGCGGGGLLRQLAGLGFVNLLGADPFIAETLTHPDGVVVRKATLGELTGEHDCIMMHHSFEHMPNPYEVLAQARRLLAPAGRLLLRVPVCSCEAFRTYGADWVQLDAPRHFFLHSERSLRLLAERAGFEVTRVVYDSTAFQFWGSEQYRKNITLRSPTSYAENAAASLFSPSDIAALEARSRELNAKSDGDQACFVLRASAKR